VDYYGTYLHNVALQASLFSFKGKVYKLLLVRNTHGSVHYADKALQEKVVQIDTIIIFTLDRPVMLDLLSI
jgi:rRNA-processing protein FCF1